MKAQGKEQTVSQHSFAFVDLVNLAGRIMGRVVQGRTPRVVVK
jgi:hypothetical protein